ncbi:hypothetical protein Kpol_2002p51 [Vanderwaltozyma polyspora DSM 70294]|uniref:Elongation of fatty acids protein n=1 Tax=Vanderwaltozyma polyspora (strain ATCC 22028 / DSM 70294 / BCRC 21397 / CBS 2163 / NBRC 10782 / NRRL Y-8283 / UCD 57-17) TaxID=436907 RepID=A7TFG6_VANPO|nr:uncharacterized protein Kpol_2002p51 [Vanderwaltozyma polyspora DSM 70294]EDO18980.1 hypothetical protein Kpol_2002p51 [Vanderwaltozyma polyspora DSM 70294]
MLCFAFAQALPLPLPPHRRFHGQIGMPMPTLPLLSLHLSIPIFQQHQHQQTPSHFISYIKRTHSSPSLVIPFIPGSNLLYSHHPPIHSLSLSLPPTMSANDTLVDSATATAASFAASSTDIFNSNSWNFVPTVDRPFFNIYLWDHFDRIATWVSNGKFIPSQFTFEQGKGLPLSELNSALIAIALYYVIILGGSKVMQKRQNPVSFNYIFQLHNLFLTFASFTLLILMVEQLFPIIYRNGIFYAICNYGSWTQPMVTLYYLNYLVKYYEFIDTFFLVLKKKNLTFLHTYHHGATALLCYTQIVGATIVSWVPITLNLAVHCLMYWYYFLAARGIRVWWKEWVTRFQIIQFILDVAFIYFIAYQKIAQEYITVLPMCGECVGSTTAALSGASIITSYLFLFCAFYIEVYKRSGAKKRASAAEKKDSSSASAASTATSAQDSDLRKRK